ncbi:MAG: hypothetical protein AAFU85_13110 [Planctomycetota bacterium]
MRRIAFAALLCVSAFNLDRVVGQTYSHPPLPQPTDPQPTTANGLPANGLPANQANASPSFQPTPTLPAVSVSSRHTAPVPTALSGEIVAISSQVLEIDPGVEVDFEDVEYAATAQPGALIEFLSRGSAEKMVKRLVASKVARIISAPRVMTVNGQAATVQVGKEAVITRSDGTTDTRPVGLKLECRPVIAGDRLNVELRCEYSTLGSDNAINTRSLETNVLMDWDKTLALRGLEENLLLLVTPQRHLQAKVLRTGQVVYGAGEPAPAKGARFDRLVDIYSIFGGSDIAKVEAIGVGKDQLKVTATLFQDQQRKIPGILAGFAKLTPYKVTSVSQSSVEDGIRLVIDCEKQPAERPSDADVPLKDLETALTRLFPSQQIDISILPSAVLLRGNVESETIDEVIEIAQQYYPTVINHLKGLEAVGSRAEEPLPSLRENLDKLSSELSLLREEVRALIETLEIDHQTRLKQSATFSKDEAPTLKLSLDQAIDAARKHHANSGQAALGRIEKEVTQHFETLHFLQRFDEQRADVPSPNAPVPRDSALDELVAGDDQDGAIGWTTSIRRIETDEDSRRDLEKHLKQLLGLGNDERRLEPLFPKSHSAN